jgi:hypothetical protein
LCIKLCSLRRSNASRRKVTARKCPFPLSRKCFISHSMSGTECYIRSKTAQTLYLEARECSHWPNHGDVVLNHFTGRPEQIWLFDSPPGAIISSLNGTALDIGQGGGSMIILSAWKDTNVLNQRWKIIPQTGQIRAGNSLYLHALGLSEGSILKGEQVSNQTLQTWEVILGHDTSVRYLGRPDAAPWPVRPAVQSEVQAHPPPDRRERRARRGWWDLGSDDWPE